MPAPKMLPSPYRVTSGSPRLRLSLLFAIPEFYHKHHPNICYNKHKNDVHMKYKLKPTKRYIKLSVAILFFSVVFIRYNQQRPALKVKSIEAQQAQATKTPEKPPATDTNQGDRQAKRTVSTIQKQVAANQTLTQKRYYLLDTPNDTYYNSTWYLQNINAPAAWNITNSSAGVTIAVIDSGFALNHQDLSARWKLNSGESGDGKETDGIDNDNNGYVDDYRGWDFVAGDNSPQAGTLNSGGSGVSHGTETSGLAGASSNNSLGIATVSRNANILPLQVIDDNGSGYSDDVADAIYYAVDQGVDVINMSLGTSGDDPTVRAAVDYAFGHNVVVVAAAGNCGNNATGACAGQVAGYVTFPANYNRVIAVGATDSSNTRASFSSYGERLDIMAPGSGTLISTTWTSGNGTSLYASNLFGTSYASPIVASSAALIRSIRPDTSIDDVRALLMGGATKLTPMSSAFYSQTYGHGLLNIGKSIQIGSELNTSGEAEPSLEQTGGPASEHIYASTDSLGSGCVATALTWCTVWLRNDPTNFERFLPYAKTSAGGTTGWTYSAAALNKGVWDSRARQGDIVSTTPYMLFRK